MVLLCLLMCSGAATAQIAVELEKMNALYPVVENPLRVIFENTPDSNLLLIPSRGEIKRKSVNHYIWQICERDTHIVFLQVFDTRSGILLKKAEYRLKRLPSPVPLSPFGLDKSKYNFAKCSGYQTGGIALVFRDFDFDIGAKNLGFDVTYIPKGLGSYTKHNKGARFSSEVSNMLNRASVGDIYIFHNFKYRLPCDPMVHYLENELIYTVK